MKAITRFLLIVLVVLGALAAKAALGSSIKTDGKRVSAEKNKNSVF
jgi:hypothetical protein